MDQGVDSTTKLREIRDEERKNRRVIFKSKLHVYGFQVLQMRNDKKTLCEIQKWLKTQGVSIGTKAISRWINRYA